MLVKLAVADTEMKDGEQKKDEPKKKEKLSDLIVKEVDYLREHFFDNENLKNQIKEDKQNAFEIKLFEEFK